MSDAGGQRVPGPGSRYPLPGYYGFPPPWPPPPAPKPRRRVALVFGIAALVVLLVAAGLIWLLNGNDEPDRKALGEAPFAGAIAALANSPEVHYRTTVDDLGAVDVRATHAGELTGTAEQGGETVQLLRVGGRVYAKLPDSELGTTDNPAQANAMSGKWLTGKDVASKLASVPDRFVPPQQLASLLAGAVNGAEPLPDTNIGGQPVVGANTRLGALYVTRDLPYRVVRLTPEPAPEATAHPAIYSLHAAAAATAAGSSTDFPAEQPQDLDQTYDQLKSATAELADSIDTDLSFDLDGDGQINCSEAGCQVNVTVTNSVAASTPGTSTVGGNVTAELTATVTIDGQPAGGCAGAGSLPLNGTGTVSCSAASAGGVFSAAKAQKRAAAEAQSETEGGAPVPYNVAFAGQYYVYATAQVDVESTVQQVDRNNDDAVKLYKAPAKGLTQKLLDQGFQPEDFPGDPASYGYPDGRAYFGLSDRGKDIALDYASRGGYDSTVIEVVIPREEFEQYFGDDVLDYDTVPGAQVAVPNTSFGILNSYPRVLAR